MCRDPIALHNFQVELGANLQGKTPLCPIEAHASSFRSFPEPLKVLAAVHLNRFRFVGVDDELTLLHRDVPTFQTHSHLVARIEFEYTLRDSLPRKNFGLTQDLVSQQKA